MEKITSNLEVIRSWDSSSEHGNWGCRSLQESVTLITSSMGFSFWRRGFKESHLKKHLHNSELKFS